MARRRIFSAPEDALAAPRATAASKVPAGVFCEPGADTTVTVAGDVDVGVLLVVVGVVVAVIDLRSGEKMRVVGRRLVEDVVKVKRVGRHDVTNEEDDDAEEARARATAGTKAVAAADRLLLCMLLMFC